MTATGASEYITKPQTLTEMTMTLVDLLNRADNSNLPAPAHVTLYQRWQEARLGFRGEPDSFHALADWATRFGGTVTAEPYTRDDGEQSIDCQVKFPFVGLAVEVYAMIPADQLSST